MLKESAAPLREDYDLAILDLDGVVYIGPDAVPHAAVELGAATAAGMRVAYVTNNASRPPAVVAEHLRRLGIPAADEDVVTSSQAAARLLADQLPAGSAVYVIGGGGLVEALTERGLTPVGSVEDSPVAVVSGYHPDLRWKTVMDGAILVARGLPWVATNTDRSVPTPSGPGPGNGVLVDAVAGFAGRVPTVAGKPATPLFAETRLRAAGDRPLVVGDRLDTDIAGATASGLDSLLVMTGVTGLAELVAAQPSERPSYVAADLRGLAEAHPVPKPEGEGWALGRWRADVDGDGKLRVTGDGSRDDWWRVVATAAWAHHDTTGGHVDASRLSVPGSVRGSVTGDGASRLTRETVRR